MLSGRSFLGNEPWWLWCCVHHLKEAPPQLSLWSWEPWESGVCNLSVGWVTLETSVSLGLCVLSHWGAEMADILCLFLWLWHTPCHPEHLPQKCPDKLWHPCLLHCTSSGPKNWVKQRLPQARGQWLGLKAAGGSAFWGTDVTDFEAEVRCLSYVHAAIQLKRIRARTWCVICTRICAWFTIIT